MIVDVIKYLFVGSKEDLDVFFTRAQKKGLIEFIPSEGKKPLDVPLEVQKMMGAIKLLRKCPPLPHVFPSGDGMLAKDIAEAILQDKSHIEKLNEEIRLLEADIVRVEVFGDFSLDDIRYIEQQSGKKIQFFCMKTTAADKNEIPAEAIYIGTEFDLDYFMAVSAGDKSYPGMIEIRVTASIGELKKKLSHAKEELHKKEQSLDSHAKYLGFLEKVLIEELNAYHLESAKSLVNTPLDGGLFSIEAWVPKNKQVNIYGLMDGLAVIGEPIGIEQYDKVPTFMENTGVNLMGEDLVKIYDTPSTKDKDPSGWVIWAFTLFFAMIVADGGYGLLYLSIAFFLHYKFPKLKGQSKRLLKLLFVLSTACVLWGLASCSFFGVYIKPGTFLSDLSLVRYMAEKKAEYHFERKDNVYNEWITLHPDLSQKSTPRAFLHEKIGDEHPVLDAFTDNVLLELSLLVGAIHICFSFLRYIGRNLSGIGWITFIVGGYLFFPSMLHATSMINFLGLVDKQTAAGFGLQLVYGGIGAAVLFSLIQNKLKGLSEILNVISVFGDILSYLRIYALGLAGSIMASTFNALGGELGLAVGVLIVLMGHSVNILLSVMGGVIHGLRLNFLEWYHYSFEGGGKLFQPLKRFTVE